MSDALGQCQKKEWRNFRYNPFKQRSNTNLFNTEDSKGCLFRLSQLAGEGNKEPRTEV